MSFRVSPGVYPRIIDDSLQATFINPSIASVVGGALRGPLGPREVTNYPQRKKLYGVNTPSWGYMLDAADAYLLQGTQLWMNRVVAANAKWSTGLISNNVVAGRPAGTSFSVMPNGSTVDYTGVNRDVRDIEVVGTFVAGTSCTVTINGVAGPATSFSVDHNTTMGLIQQAIVTALAGLGSDGWCDLPQIGAQDQIIRIIGPNAITLAVSVAFAGAGAPTGSVRVADWLAVVVSENPGIWSDPAGPGPGVAVGITNVDAGVPERLTVSLSLPVLTGQTLSMTINAVTVTAAFATSSNVTVQNFCNAFAVAFPGGSAAPVISGTTNNLQFILVAPNSVVQLVVTAAAVTGSGTKPIVSSVVSLSSTPSTGSFNFVVYENATFTSPDELYLCTYGTGVDGLGNPTNFAYVVNGVLNGTGSASPRVRVVVNPLFSGVVNGPTNVTNSNYERYLEGGADGSVPSTQQVVAGWTAFSNPEAVTIRIMINAGYTDPAVHQEMIAVAASRMDCFAILDTPSASQDPQGAANWRTNVQDVDSYWGALYSPDVLIYDQNMGVRRYVPPSGIVAGAYAYTDSVAAEWFAPAGLTRGIITQALGLRYVYGEGDRDVLSAAQVNAIRKYGSAWTIWGEYTLQQAMSALQSVPVVRLMITVMTEAAGICAYSVFEPNDPFTWHKIQTRLNAILGPIQNAEGITDFYVQCDASNNTPDIIDERVCLVAMWIKPTLSILYLRLDGIVTRQSAVFSVEAAAAHNAF